MGATYKVGDSVTFTVGETVLRYSVKDAYLQNVSGDNEQIFHLLRLNKTGFCSKAYGYECGVGLFPEYRHGDLQAVGRVIEALHEECRKFNEGKTELYVDMYVPLPAPPGAVHLEVIEDIRRGDIRTPGQMPNVIKAGTITWHDKDRWLDVHVRPHEKCHPEGNRWSANIPRRYFKVIEQQYPTKLGQSTPKVDMKAIQAECMKRYPIGCTYIQPKGGTEMVLLADAITYEIAGNMIYAHNGGGCLYSSGEWATIIPQKSDSIVTLAHNGDDISCQVIIQTQPESIGVVEKTTAPAFLGPLRMKRLTPSFKIN
jgi:hypothetical protein